MISESKFYKAEFYKRENSVHNNTPEVPCLAPQDRSGKNIRLASVAKQ